MIVEPFLQSSLYFIWKETCLDIPQLMCKTDKKEECQDLHRLFCAEEPELDCHSLPRRNCTLKPTVEIKDVSNTECNTEFRTVCTKIFNQVHLVNLVNIAVVYPYLLSGLHCQWGASWGLWWYSRGCLQRSSSTSDELCGWGTVCWSGKSSM